MAIPRATFGARDLITLLFPGLPRFAPRCGASRRHPGATSASALRADFWGHLELPLPRPSGPIPKAFLKVPIGLYSGTLLDEISHIMWQLFKEFILFLRQEKKWWLIPLIIILLLMAAVIVFTGGSVLAPLMYPFV